jgi:hypothetical protein
MSKERLWAFLNEKRRNRNETNAVRMIFLLLHNRQPVHNAVRRCFPTVSVRPVVITVADKSLQFLKRNSRILALLDQEPLRCRVPRLVRPLHLQS